MDGFKLPTIPPHTLQPEVNREDLKVEEIVGQWLSKFGHSVAENSLDGLSELFLDDCWWRDFISMQWDFTSKNGLDSVRQYLATAKNCLTDIKPIELGGLKPVLVDLGGMIWIQGGFTFKTAHGSGRGLVKLLNTQGTTWKAWTVFTQLERLDFQDELDRKRALNPAAALRDSAVKEAQQQNAAKDDLQVLIVGSGQAGLCLGARLKNMGIKTLLIDRHDRFGGAWRARYKSVTLNTPTYTDHPPFTKIPENWPRWLPRDMVAEFWEHYGNIMGLECLSNSDVTNIEYDESARMYTVSVKSGDWSTSLKTRHVVLATGTFSDEPIMPQFSGQEDFKGRVYHSSQHTSAEDIPDVHNKKVVVVGPGTSGHDIAQDFVNHGAKEVSLIQRHPIFYLSATSSEHIQLALWNMDGVSTEEADLLGNAIPLAVIRTMGIGMTHMMTELDKEMIEGLQKAGLALRTGQDGYGLADYQLIKGGHFYVDQGASQMIIDGKIKVHRCEEGVTSFESGGLSLGNGTKLEADVVVLATGYQGSIRTVEKLMGRDIAAKMSKHFGVLDTENERAGWWRPTGQPGFWYMTGSFMWCRQFSLQLALQIAAVEKGLNGQHYSQVPEK